VDVSGTWVDDIELRLVSGGNISELDIRALIDAVNASWKARGIVLSHMKAIRGAVEISEDLAEKQIHSFFLPRCILEDWISWMAHGKGIPTDEYDRLYALLPKEGVE